MNHSAYAKLARYRYATPLVPSDATADSSFWIWLLGRIACSMVAGENVMHVEAEPFEKTARNGNEVRDGTASGRRSDPCRDGAP